MVFVPSFISPRLLPILCLFSLFIYFFFFSCLFFFPPGAGAETDYFSLQGMIFSFYRNYCPAAYDSEIVIFWKKENNPLEKFESPFPSTIKLFFCMLKMGNQSVKPVFFPEPSANLLAIVCSRHNTYFFGRLYRDWWFFRAAQNFRTLGNMLSSAELVGKGLHKATYHFTFRGSCTKCINISNGPARQDLHLDVYQSTLSKYS